MTEKLIDATKLIETMAKEPVMQENPSALIELVAQINQMADEGMTKERPKADTLLPCPFCGCEPVMDCLMETANIICPNCNAHIFKMAKSHELAKTEAIEAWNRRAEK